MGQPRSSYCEAAEARCRGQIPSFSKYDEGIKMDEEGWFSVTPVEIAMRHAEKCGGDELVIDCFSGIQCADRKHGDALEASFVLAIDIDPQKVNMALNNAKVYGVEDNIDFIVGYFFPTCSIFEDELLHGTVFDDLTVLSTEFLCVPS
ncbi:trimethylguanosine synthase-like [Gossypium australe]|uniref:Trimethylguanosine synthase n=1 Tax=Gossypium australe TaxID=47621 RepID=A0A5B6WCV9_9ROSI|nr:trimethylguanosine synthase-like [Gossypium australe]